MTPPIAVLLQWLPILNLLIVPLSWAFKRHIERVDQLVKRVELHEILISQMRTVCRYNHPDAPENPPTMFGFEQGAH